MLLTNAKLATMTDASPYGIIDNGAIVINHNKIEWVGETCNLPDNFKDLKHRDLNGNLVTPGLIDCHTHIVHGGNRSNEFEMRLLGSTYEEIANRGGGIISTVKNTRNLSIDELFETSLVRLDKLLEEGITAIEIKSGYGLDKNNELKMLRVARMLEQERQVRVKTSFLGAHAIPPEFKNSPEKYIKEICLPTLEEAVSENLVDAVDGFCEKIAFNTSQIEILFKKADELKLPVKLHAEQLSNIGGIKLAAKFNALSVDHIEYATKSDIQAISKSGTIAVLLPGAFYTLRETQYPPINHLRSENVDIAIATDNNPGSSPLTSILLSMNMACTIFKLTPEEALLGVTKNAAKALNLNDCGTIEIGKRSDLCIWNVGHPAELSYRIGFNPLVERMFGSK